MVFKELDTCRSNGDHFNHCSDTVLWGYKTQTRSRNRLLHVSTKSRVQISAQRLAILTEVLSWFSSVPRANVEKVLWRSQPIPSTSLTIHHSKIILPLWRWQLSGILRRVVSWKLTDVSEMRTDPIIRTMTIETVSTSETSINFYETTQRNIREGCHLHTRLRENLKSHHMIRRHITYAVEETYLNKSRYTRMLAIFMSASFTIVRYWSRWSYLNILV
jgi:hypothetical protein